MKKITSLFFISSLLLTACSSDSNKQPVSYPKPREELELERMGKLTGEEGITIFGGKRKNKASGEAINVNAYLWRASLDTIYFMPLISADPFGGTILTDWYASSSNANERFKFNIIIVGAELRSDAIKVAVFKQIKNKNGQWIDSSSNDKLAKQMEDQILIKARELKVNNS